MATGMNGEASKLVHVAPAHCVRERVRGMGQTIPSHFLTKLMGRNKSTLEAARQPNDYQRQPAILSSARAFVRYSDCQTELTLHASTDVLPFPTIVSSFQLLRKCLPCQLCAVRCELFFLPSCFGDIVAFDLKAPPSGNDSGDITCRQEAAFYECTQHQKTNYLNQCFSFY